MPISRTLHYVTEDFTQEEEWLRDGVGLRGTCSSRITLTAGGLSIQVQMSGGWFFDTEHEKCWWPDGEVGVQRVAQWLRDMEYGRRYA